MSQTNSPEEQGEPEVPEGEASSKPGLHPLGTVMFTWLILIFGLVQALTNLVAPVQLTKETVPGTVRAAIQVAELDLAASVARTTDLAASDPAAAMGDFVASLDRTRETYAILIEMVEPGERLDLLARRAVLEAERGNLEATKWTLSALDDSDEAEEFSRAFQLAYEEGELSPDEPIDVEELAIPSSGWTRDVLLARLANIDGDHGFAEELERDILERGRRANASQLSLRWGKLLVVPLGLIALVLWWRRSFAQRRIGEGLSLPPWNQKDGLAVVVRTFVFGVLLAHFAYLTDLAAEETSFFSWGSFWFSLPMIYLMLRYLLRPHGLSLTSSFGLSLRGGEQRGASWLTLIGATCLLLSAQQLGLELISSLTNSIGWYPRWSDLSIPQLVVGSNAAFGIIAVDELLWGPLCLELAFRGLVYQYLRTRMSPYRAAFVSAILFGLMYFSSGPTFLGVVWVGFLWAISFEFTRSLLPAVFCHAVWNGLALALIATYR